MMDERLKEILHKALDDALHEHIAHLFAVWMKDDSGQPERAATGARRAIVAWRQAVQAIETMGSDHD